MRTTTEPAPALYIADLAAYNAGRLRGEWIRLEDFATAEGVMERISELLSTWNADPIHEDAIHEEYAVHDFEGLPRSLYSEHMGREGIAAAMQYAHMIGDVHTDRGALDAYFAAELARGLEPDEWLGDFEERYQGTYASRADWAHDYCEGVGYLAAVPEALSYHIDFDGFARDAELSGDVTFASDGGRVHVFRAR